MKKIESIVKKILCAAIVMTSLYEASKGMSACTLSYHSIVKEDRQKDNYHVTCENREELQEELSKCALEFANASLFEKKSTASSFLDKFMKVFCQDERMIQCIKEAERDGVENLTDAKINEVADDIAYLCNGIPESATKIHIAYEAIGDYQRSLVWATVALRFGIRNADIEIGRFLNLLT